MRPIYKNDTSKGNEARIAKLLEGHWKCIFTKLPRKNILDYSMLRKGKLIGYCEIKSRKVAKDTYPTWMVSLEKWMYAQRIAEASNGVPMFFVVEWLDGIYYLRQDDAQIEVGVGGRTDRGDDLDVELCVFVTTNQFRPLETA